MFVQHTEAMLEEIYRMEVEMENTTNELVVDIESSDKRNPLAVVEYINDIYAYYKKVESSSCVLPNYMGQQFDINERMRGILIDWLIEDQFDLQGNPSDVASFLIQDLIWTCLVIWRAEATSFCVFVHITLHVFWLRCKFYIFVGIIGHVW